MESYHNKIFAGGIVLLSSTLLTEMLFFEGDSRVVFPPLDNGRIHADVFGAGQSSFILTVFTDKVQRH